MFAAGGHVARRGIKHRKFSEGSTKRSTVDRKSRSHRLLQELIEKRRLEALRRAIGLV